jgi:YD repeat-containing protein
VTPELRHFAASRSAAGSVVTASTFGTSATGPHRLVSQTVTGQSVVSFSWDAAGNRTGRTQGASSSSFTWDAEGELVSSTAGSTSVSSVYDADGSRLVKFEGANVTVYLPGGMEVSSSSTTAVSSTRWYSFAGKTVAHRTGNGLAGVTSVVTDHQGTVVGTVHNTDWAAGVSRKRPDPFGGSRSSSSSVTAQGRGFWVRCMTLTRWCCWGPGIWIR